jgi:YHS domain-containing protein
MRPLKYLFACIGIILATGCAPLVTQSPGAGLSPVNAVSVEGDKHLMLFGHDVVSYFTEGTHKLGTADIKSVYKDVTFRFSKAEHKTLFDREPTKYIPQFGGYCANGIVYSIPWGGDADAWRIIDGKLYIFGGKGSLDAFLLDVPGNLKLANKYWDEEVSGSNAFLHRSKRTTLFKVAHYKSGAQLAEEVAKAGSKAK